MKSKKIKYNKYVYELDEKRRNAKTRAELEDIEYEAQQWFFKTDDREYILLAKSIELELTTWT